MNAVARTESSQRAEQDALDRQIAHEWARVRVLMEEGAHKLARVAMADALRWQAKRTRGHVLRLEREKGLR